MEQINIELMFKFVEWVGDTNYYYTGDNLWSSSELNQKPLLTEELYKQFKKDYGTN